MMVFFKDSFFAKNFALLLVLNSLYIALAQFYNIPKLFDSYWWYSFFYREAMLFCTYFMAFCLIYYVPFKRIKNAFVLIVTLASVLLLIVNLFLVLNFGGTLNEHLVGVALQSDPNETREFLGEYLSLKFGVLSLLTLGILALVYRYGNVIFAKLTHGGGGALKVFWIVFLTLLIALIAVHIFRLRPHYERSSDVIYNATSSVKGSLDFILGAMNEYKELDANFAEFIKDINFTKAPKDKQIQNIILIIGESAQRNLMQIYGYYLPNTPNFARLSAEKPNNLFIFDNVISTQVTTFESLSQVLSFANQDDIQTPWYRYLNLIDIMKLGGYKSIVISNQEQFSLWSKATTTIFSRSDELHWTSSSKAGNSLDTMKPDGAILPILDEVLSAQDKDKSLFVSLHLMGNHIHYFNRYPKEFERFKAQDIHSTRGKQTLAQNANAIFYTDFILDEIIKRFANSDSIVLYISDHGDDVFDTGNAPLRTDSKITRFMLEIPFVVYASDEFRAKHPEIYARIKNATKKPFMIDDLIHALIDIAGFEISGFEPQRSLFNAEFNANRKRFVGKKAEINYDETLKNQPRVE